MRNLPAQNPLSKQCSPVPGGQHCRQALVTKHRRQTQWRRRCPATTPSAMLCMKVEVLSRVPKGSRMFAECCAGCSRRSRPCASPDAVFVRWDFAGLTHAAVLLSLASKAALCPGPGGGAPRRGSTELRAHHLSLQPRRQHRLCHCMHSPTNSQAVQARSPASNRTRCGEVPPLSCRHRDEALGVQLGEVEWLHEACRKCRLRCCLQRMQRSRQHHALQLLTLASHSRAS